MFLRVFGRVRMRSDAFGCVRIRSDAIGCIWVRSDAFRRFGDFLRFLVALGYGGNVFGWLSGRGQSILGGFRVGGNV